ncbi:MAG: hypothetical protein ACTHOD_17095 [Motilibacteraceae bacterium]
MSTAPGAAGLGVAAATQGADPSTGSVPDRPEDEDKAALLGQTAPDAGVAGGGGQGHSGQAESTDDNQDRDFPDPSGRTT